MKHFALTLLLITVFMHGTKAQYYYNDVLALKQASLQYDALLKTGNKKMQATSYDENNQIVKDFTLQQTVDKNGKRIIIYSSLNNVINTTVNDYDSGRIINSVVKSGNIITTTNYEYDKYGNLTGLNIVSFDSLYDYTTSEKHVWIYEGGTINKMLKIKNNKDTVFVEFKKDENQNIIEEVWANKTHILEHYFYYYNRNNELTDIVRYNLAAKRLLPDFLFEYDEKGRIIQLTEMPANKNNYLIWRYDYTPEGLKKSEVLYNKHRQQIGRVVYSYSN